MCNVFTLDVLESTAPPGTSVVYSLNRGWGLFFAELQFGGVGSGGRWDTGTKISAATCLIWKNVSAFILHKLELQLTKEKFRGGLDRKATVKRKQGAAVQTRRGVMSVRYPRLKSQYFVNKTGSLRKIWLDRFH